MSVDAVRRGLCVVAVIALLGFFCGYAAAFELGNDTRELSGVLLAQQSQDATGQMQDTPRGDILKDAGKGQEAETEAESEDEYDDKEDEYADDEVELIAE
jgi:HAMP domain-containing protein